jgi:UDP-glucose 6-dehydrogenase
MEENKNLSFTSDTTASISSSDVIFVCVNTNSKAHSNPSSYGVELDMGAL